MAGIGFVKLGKCFVDSISKCSKEVVDDLVLNTLHINKIQPLKIENGEKLGARITTVFGELIDVPAPSVVLDDNYIFSDIVHMVANAGKEGFSSLF